MALFELFVVFSAPIYLLLLYRNSDFNAIYYTLQMMDCSFRYVFSLWIGCSFSDELFQNDGFCLFVCDIKASFVDRQSEYHPARNLKQLRMPGHRVRMKIANSFCARQRHEHARSAAQLRKNS